MMKIIKGKYKKLSHKLIPPVSNNKTLNEIMSRFVSVVFIYIIIAVVILSRMIFIVFFHTPTPYVTKDINIEFKRAINKGCEYEDLKIIFDNKERVLLYYYDADLYYKPTVNLDIILTDMIYDYYKSETYDTVYIKRLNDIRNDALIKFPFDKLTAAQKNIFEKIRDNSNEQYKNIETEVILLANEIYDKNYDIEIYLNKANQSYYISIFALLITLVPFIKPSWRYFRSILNKYK